MSSVIRLIYSSGLVLGLSFLAGIAAGQPSPTGGDGTRQSAASDRSSRPVLPSGWQANEYEVPSRRFTLEIARFPTSTMVAGYYKMGMEQKGWGPLQVATNEKEDVVYLGNFSSISAAMFAAKELELQDIPSAKIVDVPQGITYDKMGVDGPLRDPFTPSTADSRLIDAEQAARQVAMLVESPPAGISDPARLALEKLAIESNWAAFGNDAGVVAAELARLKVEVQLAFFLSSKVASGEWPASDPVRLAAGEVAADLLYGWLRDWRATWAASNALLEDPARSPAGRARDRLRLAAVEVDHASAPTPLRPEWNRVRLQLRRAWDEVPLNAEREQAKIELVYLQTFAWEGNWGRVEELGRQFVARHKTRFPHEAGLALLMVAQSMERREAWDEALEMLDGHFAGRPLPAQDGLYMGFDRLDLSERYRQARRRLASSKIAGESGLDSTDQVETEIGGNLP
jgi:hypothetical protein